jgi:plastocyanin
MGYGPRGWGRICALPWRPRAHPPGGAAQRGGAFVKSWNSRCALVAALLGAAVLAVAGSAFAVGGKGPAKAKVIIKGNESVVINAYSKVSFHFGPGTVPIRSGGTVTLTNTTTDGHTLSIVKQSQLPRTINQIQNCSICGAIAKSHGINFEGPPTEGPPPFPVVNVGAAGFDAPGDSVVIGPKGHGGPVTFKVTARPGTILHFICAFHPWMQGRFLVK